MHQRPNDFDALALAYESCQTSRWDRAEGRNMDTC